MYNYVQSIGVLKSEPQIEGDKLRFLLASQVERRDPADRDNTIVNEMYYDVHVSGELAKAMIPVLAPTQHLLIGGWLQANEYGRPTVYEDGTVFFEVSAYTIVPLHIMTQKQLTKRRDFNQLTILGNLGGDPEMRYIDKVDDQGEPINVANFSIATNTVRNKEKITTWFRVTAWRKAATTLVQYLGKGSSLFLIGKLDFDPETGGPPTWESTKYGLSSTYEVTLNTFKFVGKSDGEQNGVSPYSAPPEEEIPF